VKIFVLAPKEDWICDRLVSEFTNEFKSFCVDNPYEADIIWLLAGWCWNHIPVQLLKNKKVIVTEHHIVPDKFTQQKYKNFLIRDQFVDCYHVPNNKTAFFVNRLTNKKVKVINYWLNDKLWIPGSKKEAQKYFGLDSNSFYVGSFQRDTEGNDLQTPKLEKGPDIFCDYLEKHQSKFSNLHVILGGWRRQYVQKRLEAAKIKYTLFEKTSLNNIKKLYEAIDLYIVSSRQEGGPQAIIEAASMKVPIISTDVGIADLILTKNCIVDLTKDFYIPTQEDINKNYENVSKIKLSDQGKKFINLFKEILI
jgi:glycosyltransferase involved in cell wall biosynthesis